MIHKIGRVQICERSKIRVDFLLRLQMPLYIYRSRVSIKECPRDQKTSEQSQRLTYRKLKDQDSRDSKLSLYYVLR